MATISSPLKWRNVGWAVVGGLLSFLLLSWAEGLLNRFGEERRDFYALITLKKIFPVFDNDPSQDTVIWIDSWGGALKFYRARQNGNCVAAAFPVTVYGYRGFVRAVAGIDINGKVEHIFLLNEKEAQQFGAPGINQAWLDGFAGLEPSQIRLGPYGGRVQPIPKQFYASARFADAVRQGAQFFIDHKNEILQIL